MTTDESRFQDDYLALLKEASDYFMARGDVYTTLQNLTRRLDEEEIPYALAGGLALAAHGLVQMTEDVALYTETQVRIEILITGDYPGDGKPKPVVFPDPSIVFAERGGMRVIPMETLIELKLASGISAPHRLRDLADVQDLILALKLPIELADTLDASVRETFRDLWQSVQDHTANDSN